MKSNPDKGMNLSRYGYWSLECWFQSGGLALRMQLWQWYYLHTGWFTLWSTRNIKTANASRETGFEFVAAHSLDHNENHLAAEINLRVLTMISIEVMWAWKWKVKNTWYSRVGGCSIWTVSSSIPWTKAFWTSI